MSARERYLLAATAASPTLEQGRRVKPVEQRHRAAAIAVLRKNKPICQALLDLGYSPKQSRKGMWIVEHNYALRTAFAEETAKMQREKWQAPIEPDWDTREAAIVKRLDSNIKSGRDKAIGSCKLLGSHRRLNLWEPEYKTGVVILNAPANTPFSTDMDIPNIPAENDD